MKTVFTIGIIIFMMLIASIAWSDIIHVPDDQPTIQAGIDAAQHGDTVLVADGTYKGNGNKNLDFKGKAITVTSENGAEHCIIDCEYDGLAFCFDHEKKESVLSGFTIMNGSNSYGGAIRCLYSSSPTIENNIIVGNAAYEGGGIHCFQTGNPGPTITNNVLIGNSATCGGGIYCDDATPIITNNIITQNSATYGGGIYCYQWAPMIINNTITRNSATQYGGGVVSWTSRPTVLNTILWNNIPQEIYVDDLSELDITYSDVRGGWEGEGNIDADPLFIDPRDFHFSDYSPCIGAGIMTLDVLDRDIEDNPRPNPPGSNPDIGAYENQLGEPLPISGSINGTVTDMAGNPIKRALVIAVLGETKKKAFTDSEGYYEIPDLEPGTYWVLCIKKGYKAGIKKVEVEPGKETPCPIVLKTNLDL